MARSLTVVRLSVCVPVCVGFAAMSRVLYHLHIVVVRKRQGVV